MNRGIRLFALLAMAANGVVAGELKAFTSDGCSVFPEGTAGQSQLWLHCCVEHDYAYWKGGSHEARQAADERLRECVAEAGEPGIAELMFLGVRVGGSPYLPTPFRWGFGWPYPKFHDEVGEEES